MKKKTKVVLIVISIVVALLVGAYFLAMSHTQIIVSAIQSLSRNVVNTENLFHPLNNPIEGVKDNGQYIITELNYSKQYPNSYLDITYPDSDTSVQRLTLFYFHGGGFFGGSKSLGDPLAESDVTALLDDICKEGFNIVNVDYAFVPEYRFPTPLVQANLAFGFCVRNAGKYHLDMSNVIIMGSSAGAIITSQIATVISNPDYAALLGIEPVLSPDQVKAVVIDDAPLVYDEFALNTKILIGNYVKGSIYLSHDDIYRYNNIYWVNPDFPPAVLLGSEYCKDMRALASRLNMKQVRYHLVDPLAEQGLVKPHCFVAKERVDDVSRDAYERMMSFIQSCL